MKYAVKMWSCALIYIPSFIKIGSGIQKLIRRDSQTHRQHGDLISLLLFFKIRKIGLKYMATYEITLKFVRVSVYVCLCVRLLIGLCLPVYPSMSVCILLSFHLFVYPLLIF
jgi:hypothetical protein